MNVYKRSNSRFWWVKITHNKKSFYLSTKTENRDEAEQIALVYRRRLSGLSRDKAVAMLDLIMGEHEPFQGKAFLIRDLPATWQSFLKDEGSPISEKETKRRLNTCHRFVEWTKRNGALQALSEVTPDVAWRFVSDCGGTAKTRQNISGSMSAVWGVLIRRGVVRDNPWKYARPKSNAAEQRTGRAFTPEEMTRILAVAKGTPWLYTAILVALYTGLRRGDVFALQWEDVDLETGVIRTTPSKTSRFNIHAVVPVHPILLAHLRTLDRADSVILPAAPNHTEKAWNACLRKAGIEQIGNEKMTFHNLRHTFITWVRMTGADKGDTMFLCGHTNMATNNRYDHATTRLKEVIDKLPTV